MEPLPRCSEELRELRGEAYRPAPALRRLRLVSVGKPLQVEPSAGREALEQGRVHRQ